MLKRKLCKNCKTGRMALDLDKNYPMCPYIIGYKNGKCSRFVKDKSLSKLIADKLKK